MVSLVDPRHRKIFVQLGGIVMPSYLRLGLYLCRPTLLPDLGEQIVPAAPDGARHA